MVPGSAVAAPAVLASLRDGYAALDRFPPASSIAIRKPIAELSASPSAADPWSQSSDAHLPLL